MSDQLSVPTLPSISWLSLLKEDDRDLLSSYGEFFPAHRYVPLIRHGEPQNMLFVVISGRLEVHIPQEDGTEPVVAEIGPGETLGEVSVFDPGPATATVTPAEFSQVWRIADDRLKEFIDDNPGAGNILLCSLASILSQRLRMIDPYVFGLSFISVAQQEAPAAAVPESEPAPES